jgi:hypothetical protein
MFKPRSLISEFYDTILDLNLTSCNRRVVSHIKIIDFKNTLEAEISKKGL